MPFDGPGLVWGQGSRTHIDLAGGIAGVPRNLNTDGAGHRTRPARPKPLKAGLPLSLAGFNTVVLLKERYVFRTENNTKWRFISQTNLVPDIGQLLENAPNCVEVFAGFQYRHNKFGGDPRRTLNTEEKALIAGVAYHLK